MAADYFSGESDTYILEKVMLDYYNNILGASFQYYSNA